MIVEARELSKHLNFFTTHTLHAISLSLFTYPVK
jgi:hypothetical protein